MPTPTSPSERVEASLENPASAHFAIFTGDYLRTSCWDIVAWNKAASAALKDYGSIAPEERNLLKMIFLYADLQERNDYFEAVARWAVASFRSDVARAGAAETAAPLVEGLRRRSAVFDELWRDHDVLSSAGEVTKTFHHPEVGHFRVEYSSFAVDGRTDLSMVIFCPATPEDAECIRTLIRLKAEREAHA